MSADNSSTILVPVLRGPRIRAWPGHAQGGWAHPTPLGEALTRRYPFDAHFCAYEAALVERRLDSAALEGEALTKLGGTVRMVAAVFDVDDPLEKPLAQHSPKDRDEVRRALLALGWAKGPNKKVNGVSVKFYYPPSAQPPKPGADKADVDSEETVTTSKLYVDRKAQQDARVAARKTTDQNINDQFGGYTAPSKRTNEPPIRTPEPAAPREPVQGSATADQNSQPAPARAEPEVTNIVPMAAVTNMASAASMNSKERKPMTKDDDNTANSIEAELTVPAIDEWREHARRGSEMMEASIVLLEEHLAAGRPLPGWLQAKVNTTRMNELDGVDGATLLAESIADITPILGGQCPSKEAPTRALH